MENFPEQHFSYQLANCPIRDWPYRHLYLTECFPEEFYGQIRINLPAPDLMGPIGELRGAKMLKYPERFVFPVGDGGHLQRLPLSQKRFWREFTFWLTSQRIIGLLASRFGCEGKFRPDVVLVRDERKYALGPHTDTQSKVISLLFYLPNDNCVPNLGTSIYRPKPGFIADTADHYEHKDFDRVATMPYARNSMFAFARTDDSFHGVEPVMDGTRWLLQFNIYRA